MNRLFSNKPLLFAHRGGAGLFPENTLYAFRQSVRLYKADFLELDIHGSRDGHVVVIHDSTVDRTTNGSGQVCNMTLAQLKALDAGFRFTSDGGRTFPYRGKGLTIPTLREVFEEFGSLDVCINIDIKQYYPNIEHRLYNLITGCGVADKVLVTSGHPSVLNRFRRINRRGIATGANGLESTLAWLFSKVNLGFLLCPKYKALQVPLIFRGTLPIVSEKLVRFCKSKKVGLHVWTINDTDTMKRLLDMEVDGIMSDYPDRLYKVYREYGYKI